MKLSSFLLVVIIVCASLQTQAQKSIFNGRNLKGWTAHGTEKWYVQNGELVCESGPDKQYGYLSTNKSYKDCIVSREEFLTIKD
jgi:hypothetical protein